MIYLRAKETIHYPTKRNEVFTKDYIYPAIMESFPLLSIRDNKGYAHWVSKKVAEKCFDVVIVDKED